MIPVLIDAALRSLFVGLIVAGGMRAFQVRNVFVQKVALGLVLVSALAMPLVIPIAERLQLLPAKASIVLPAHPMTLLEELQTRIQAKSGSARIPRPVASAPLAGPIVTAALPQTERPSGAAADIGSAPLTQEPGQPSTEAAHAQATPAADTARAAEEMRLAPQPHRAVFSRSALAFSIYIAVAAVLFLRLALGLALTLHLWITAAPIPTRELSELHAGLHLRTSARVPSPLDDRFCNTAAC